MSNYSIIKTVGKPRINLINSVIISHLGQAKETTTTLNNEPTAISYQLPLDVTIYIDGSKLIAKDQIVDGVEVFTHIARKAHVIDFDFTLRAKEKQFTHMGAQIDTYVFPLDVDTTIPGSYDMRDFFDKVWVPDQVLDVVNPMLNALGIDKIVVETFNFKTERGSTDVPVKLKCYEAYYNQNYQGSLIV